MSNDIEESGNGWEKNVYTLQNEDLLNEHDLDIDDIKDYETIEELFEKKFKEEWTLKTEATNYVPPVVHKILYEKNSMNEFNEFNRFLRFLSTDKNVFLEAILHLFAEYLDENYSLLERLLNVVNKRQLDVQMAQKYGISIPEKTLFG